MAYQAGSGGDISSLMAAIRDFAVSLGWTKSGEGTSGTGGFLFLEKGICHIAMQYYTNTTVGAYDDNGNGITLSNYQIRASANRSINTALTTYYGHPGFPSGSSENGPYYYYFCAQCHDLTSPLSAWHLFSNAAGDYIHVAINTQLDRWTHFAFGKADQGSMTHGGVAYVTGTANIWYRNSNNNNPANDAWYYYNAPRNQNLPFANVNCQLYVPDAFPSGFSDIITTGNASGTTNATARKSLTTFNRPSDLTNNLYGSSMLDGLVNSSTPAWSGQVALHGSPVMATSTDGSKICIVGMYPDVRLLNMEGLLPGSEIQLGTDTWKVFPMMRQQSWSVSGTLTATSGQYAVAYKKIP